MSADIRIRIAAAAAIATVVLLSVISAAGYVAAVDAARESQLDGIDDRITELEGQLVNGDDDFTARLELGLSLQVIRTGDEVGPPLPGSLQLVRPSTLDGVEAIVGRVSTQQLDDTFAAVRTGLWVSVAVIGLLVGAAAWIVVDRALSPIRSMTNQVRAIEADRSRELLPVEGSGDEIAELAETFNEMLNKLRAADTDRRRFVSDASHELRTPLMVLAADAEYALSHGTDSEELALSVQAQSERLATLVDDLLTLASIDEGLSGDADPERGDRARTVAQVIDSADAMELATVEAAAASEVVADVSRSLSNLVANAQRHKTTDVSVRVENTGGQILFTVDDDGPGIPGHQRPHIFKRFYRADEGRRRADGGGGLGLAIAQAEVNQAGGSLSVTDSPLGGAQFRMTVPVLQQPADS